MIRGNSFPQEDPKYFGLGKNTHPVFQLVPLEKNEQSSAWSEGTAAHPMADAMGRPEICLVWKVRLTHYIIACPCKGKAERVHD